MELRVLLYMHYLIQKNISGGGIRCRYNRYKNKKFLDPDVVTIHLLQKKFMEKYLCYLAHERMKGWLGQLLVLTTCMELHMIIIIVIEVWFDV